jgi:hypothetical protein
MSGCLHLSEGGWLKLNPEFEDKRAKWHVSAVRAVG